MKKNKIIITSAGAGPSIAVIKALKTQKEIPFEIIAMDMDITAAGLYLADRYIVSPSVNDDNFIDFMLDYCRKEKINFVLPIFDIETPLFAKNKKRFKKEAGVEVLVNDYNVIDTCNDKLKTYWYCKKNNIIVPKIYTNEERNKRSIAFPVLLKPRFGIGSNELLKIANEKELEAILPLKDGFLLQEYIEGVEYTIDSISDFNGCCLIALPRERMVVKAGQTVKGRSVYDLRLIEYGKTIAEKFRIKGPACAQCKIKEERIYFIEMNPRYGTGISLSVGAGLNIPLIHLKLALNKKISKDELIFKNNYIMTRYWEEIFIDGNKVSYKLKGVS